MGYVSPGCSHYRFNGNQGGSFLVLLHMLHPLLELEVCSEAGWFFFSLPRLLNAVLHVPVDSLFSARCRYLDPHPN